MAFNIDAKMLGYEVRGVEQRTKKDGGPYVLVRLESQEGRTCEVTSSDQQIMPALLGLRKTQIVNLWVRAISSAKYSFITVTRAPELVADVDAAGVDY